MRIATFNVNGIKTRLPHLLRWLEREQPDVACLQELKALDGDRILEQFGREKLDGDWPAEPRVLRAVHDAHATFTDLVNDPVVRDSLADHGQDKPSIVGCRSSGVKVIGRP